MYSLFLIGFVNIKASAFFLIKHLLQISICKTSSQPDVQVVKMTMLW